MGSGLRPIEFVVAHDYRAIIPLRMITSRVHISFNTRCDVTSQMHATASEAQHWKHRQIENNTTITKLEY